MFWMTRFRKNVVRPYMAKKAKAKAKAPVVAPLSVATPLIAAPAPAPDAQASAKQAWLNIPLPFGSPSNEGDLFFMQHGYTEASGAKGIV